MFVKCELSVFSFFDAAQGVEFSPSSRRVAPRGAWAATAFSSLAFAGTQFVSRSSRTPASKDAHRPGQGAQPPGRPGCVGHRGFQSERGAASRIATCQRACCQAGSERAIISGGSQDSSQAQGGPTREGSGGFRQLRRS